MTELTPPFRFDLRELLGAARNKIVGRVEGVSISLPFVAFTVQPADFERRVAREVVLRMADRRVLNAYECCDNCIDRSLDSLQTIRSLLLDKRVELAKVDASPLALLLDLMLEAIRQFLTFEERLENYGLPLEPTSAVSEVGVRHSDGSRQVYFAALEMLRAHLHRCLQQVAAIADLEIPAIPSHMRYDQVWHLEAYEPLSQDEPSV